MKLTPVAALGFTSAAALSGGVIGWTLNDTDIEPSITRACETFDQLNEQFDGSSLDSLLLDLAVQAVGTELETPAYDLVHARFAETDTDAVYANSDTITVTCYGRGAP